MVKLINDSGVLKEKIKDLDNVSFDTMIQAIHVIQQNMDITGTTAKEASTTIQGSIASLKSAWENMLVGFADDNQDLKALLQNVYDSGVTVVKNIVPKVKNILNNMAGLLPDWVQNLVSQMTKVVDYAKEKFEPIFEDISKAFNILKDNVNPVIDALKDYVTNGELANNITSILKTSIDFIADAYSSLKEFIKNVIDSFKEAVEWCKKHETELTLVGIAIGTLTTAIIAYNVANGIANAGGLAHLATLALLRLQFGLSTIAMNIHTAATWAANTATTALSVAMSFLTSPITLVILAIGALIAIGVLLYKNWDVIKEKFTEFCNKIKDKVSEFLTTIKAKIMFHIENIRAFIENIVNGIVGFFTKTIPDIVKKIVNFFLELGSGIKKAFDFITNIIQVAFTFIGNIIKAAFDIITLPFRFIWENCKEYVFEAFEWIKEKISNAINKIKEIAEIGFNFVKEKIINPINETKQKAIEHFENLKNSITEKIDFAKSKVTEKVNELKEKVVEHFDNIKNKVTEKVENVKNAVTEKFNDIKENVTNKVNEIREKAIEHFENLKNGALEKINAIKDFIFSKFNAIKDKITTSTNNAKDQATNIFENLKNNLSSKIESIKSIVTDKFNSIKEKALQPINDMKDKIQEKINEIKNGFNNFTAHFKMPHFKVSGSMNPTEWLSDHSKIPSLKVEWYAKGAVLNKPTVFGINPTTGRQMVGGEAGPEAIAPIQVLMDYVRTAVAEQNTQLVEAIQRIVEILQEYFPQFALERDVVFNDTLVGAMAPKMNYELRKIRDKEERGS